VLALIMMSLCLESYDDHKGMEGIFRAMVSSDDQKVKLDTHMLAEEDEYWWAGAKRRIETSEEVVTRVRFKSERIYGFNVCLDIGQWIDDIELVCWFRFGY